MRRSRTITRIAVALAAIAVLSATAPAAAQERLSLTHYLDMESVSDPRISPDGERIVYTRGWVDKQADRRESSLWIMNADGSRARHLLDGSGARWSPDGTRILFTARGEPSGSQLFVRWMDDEGAVSQITRLENGPSGPQWSPDGEWIAFTSRVADRADFAGVELPRRPEGAQWVREPKVVERAGYKRDRQGYGRHRLDPRLRGPRRGRHRAPTDRRRLEPFRHPVEPGRQRDLFHLLSRRGLGPSRALAGVGDLRGVAGGRRHPAAYRPAGSRRGSGSVTRRLAHRLHRDRRPPRHLPQPEDPPDEPGRLRLARDLRGLRPAGRRHDVGVRRQRPLLQRAQGRLRAASLRVGRWRGDAAHLRRAPLRPVVVLGRRRRRGCDFQRARAGRCLPLRPRQPGRNPAPHRRERRRAGVRRAG